MIFSYILQTQEKCSNEWFLQINSINLIAILCHTEFNCQRLIMKLKCLWQTMLMKLKCLWQTMLMKYRHVIGGFHYQPLTIKVVWQTAVNCIILRSSHPQTELCRGSLKCSHFCDNLISYKNKLLVYYLFIPRRNKNNSH